ncbi:MAG: DUF427 domain-containing protein [Magnetovibrionaceae bacterium]
MFDASDLSTRPEYAIEIRPVGRLMTVRFHGQVVAESEGAVEMRETRHEPVIYFPPPSIKPEFFEPSAHVTHCPFKGDARYWSLVSGDKRAENAVWAYDDPIPEAAAIKGWFAFYPDRVQGLTDSRSDSIAVADDAKALQQGNPLVAWLLREGWEAATSEELLRRLVGQLREFGMPVERARLLNRTLHPQASAFRFDWSLGEAEFERVPIPHDMVSEDRFTNSPIGYVVAGNGGIRRSLATRPAADDYPVLHELFEEGYSDYAALPLAFSDGVINVLTLATKDNSGFKTDHLGLLHECLGPVSRFLEVHSQRRVAQSLMETYLGQVTGRRVLDGLVQRGDGETLEAVIWFSDLRGSTPLAESLDRLAYLEHLNAFFDHMGHAILEEGGEILRFIGDAVLAIFPITSDLRDSMADDEASLRAVRAARAALENVERHNEACRLADRPEIGFGIGLHRGWVTYGNIGIDSRLEFTVIGSAANEAARIESLTKALETPILLSEAVAQPMAGRDGEPLASLGKHDLRGVGRPIELFTLAVCHTSEESSSPNQAVRSSVT